MIMDTLNMTRIYPLPGKQRGLSLVELMISITIGLILLLGITSLIVQQSSTRDELDKSSRQIENGRYAIRLLHDDIEHAGYYGSFFSIPSTTLPVPGTLPDPCLLTQAALDAAMPLSVQGYDVSPSATTTAATLFGASGATCTSGVFIANANYKPGTDILVIRRAASVITTMAAATAGAGGQFYLQTTPFGKVLNTGANSAMFTLKNNTTANTNFADLRAYLVRIYFISPCSVMANGATCTATDDNGRPIPTLKMLELGVNTVGATSFNLIPLVEGIEQMQLDYGIDTDGDGYPDNNYATVPASAIDWSNVMAIRINLLSRNTECSTGYADIKSYPMGLASAVTAPASDCANGSGYKRHAFSELVRLVNPSGRRAKQ